MPITAFPSQGMPQSEDFKDKRLRLVLEKYEVWDLSHDRTVQRIADGTYDVVVPAVNPTFAYARRIKEEAVIQRQAKLLAEGSNKRAKEPDRGHASIIRPVDDIDPNAQKIADHAAFAGTATFNQGTLLNWTNKSGHYKIGSKIGLTRTTLDFQTLKTTRTPHIENIARLNQMIAQQTSRVMADGNMRLFPMAKFVPWSGEI